MGSIIKVACPADGEELTFSPENHFKSCSSCSGKFQKLSKNDDHFVPVFKSVMEWAVFSNHVLQIKLAMVESRPTKETMGTTQLGLEGAFHSKLLKHQPYHTSFTKPYSESMKSLNGEQKEILAGIILHIFPLLDKQNRFS